MAFESDTDGFCPLESDIQGGLPRLSLLWVDPTRVFVKSKTDFLENSISEKYKNRPVNIQGCRISS